MRNILLMIPLSIFAGLCLHTNAQTSADLMLMPWEQGIAVETGGAIISPGRSETQDVLRDKVRLVRYETNGRVRLDPTDPYSIAIGYDLTYIDIGKTHPALPRRLVDQSFGVGFGLTETELWKIGGTFALGYAGDAPYTDSDANYIKANLIFDRKMGAGEYLQIIINYDTNRAFAQHLPLPSVAWTKRESELLQYTLGLPFSGLLYTPDTNWKIKASYFFPMNYKIDVEYQLAEHWAGYVNYRSSFEGYRVDQLYKDRLFFTQKRIELGLRWTPRKLTTIIIAGGYAFDQEFETGDDSTSLNKVFEITDEPYLRIGFEFAF